MHFQTILHAAWNIRRCRQLEAAIQHECHTAGGLDPLLDDGLAAKVERIQRYARSAERTQIAATRELRALQAEMLFRHAIIPRIADEFPVTASFSGVQKHIKLAAPGNSQWYLNRYYDKLIAPLMKQSEST